MVSEDIFDAKIVDNYGYPQLYLIMLRSKESFSKYVMQGYHICEIKNYQQPRDFA